MRFRNRLLFQSAYSQQFHGAAVMTVQMRSCYLPRENAYVKMHSMVHYSLSAARQLVLVQTSAQATAAAPVRAQEQASDLEEGSRHQASLAEAARHYRCRCLPHAAEAAASAKAQSLIESAEALWAEVVAAQDAAAVMAQVALLMMRVCLAAGLAVESSCVPRLLPWLPHEHLCSQQKDAQ